MPLELIPNTVLCLRVLLSLSDSDSLVTVSLLLAIHIAQVTVTTFGSCVLFCFSVSKTLDPKVFTVRWVRVSSPVYQASDTVAY